MGRGRGRDLSVSGVWLGCVDQVLDSWKSLGLVESSDCLMLAR